LIVILFALSFDTNIDYNKNYLHKAFNYTKEKTIVVFGSVSQRSIKSIFDPKKSLNKSKQKVFQKTKEFKEKSIKQMGRE